MGKERKNKENCLCMLVKFEKVNSENGKRKLKCRKCDRVIFVEDNVNLENKIGTTRLGLGCVNVRI